jgi:peptidoglycan/LPS O-acetylase OafA/YrhL
VIKTLSTPSAWLADHRSRREKADKASGEIPSLTGIRAVAVMVVFMGHSGVPYSAAPLGVTVFFFLSGYLITTLLRKEFDRSGTISLRGFYLRRAFRILPPLYIVLILADLLTLGGAFGDQHLRLGAGLSQFFFFSNYQILHAGWSGPHTGTAPGTSPLWSLAVEEHFYLLFPLFYLALRRYIPSPRRQAAVLAAICGAVLVWRLVLILGLHQTFDRTYVGTDTRIDSILFGCILGVLGNPAPNVDGRALRTSISRWWAPILAPIGLVAFLVVYPWPGGLGPALFHRTAVSATVQYTIEGLALIPIFVVAIRYSKWGIFRLLNHPWVVLIGVLSYSMYISEQIINALVHGNVPGGEIVHGPMYLALTLGFAWAMYRVVERPCARVRKRLSAGAPRGRAVRAAAASDAAPPDRNGTIMATMHLPAATPPEALLAFEPNLPVE